jgi:hypothetical protein
MRTRSKVLLMLLLAALYFQVGGFANAAEEEELAKFQLYSEVKVKFDKISEYREAVKEYKDIMAEYELSFGWGAYQEMNRFTYCMSLNSMADLDAIQEEFIKIMSKSGDKLASVMKKIDQCVESRSKSIARLLTDLWHLPKSGGYQWDAEKSCYCEVWEFHINPDGRNGFKAMLEEYSDLLKEKKITQAVTFGETRIGQNLPSFWVASIAATKADHRKDSEKTNEILGQALVDLQEKSGEFIKDIKVNRFNYDASLSYYPKK